MSEGLQPAFAEDAIAMRLPDGYRWATGGGIGQIDGCNGRHIAIDDGRRGTLCGRYGPGSMKDPKPPRYPGDDTPCKSCLRSLRSRESK